MRFKPIRLLLLLSFAFSQQTLAQDKFMPDHGLALATAIDVAPGKLKDTIRMSDTRNYVFRGRVLTLNSNRDVHLCFDTELLRVAGAWRGKYPSARANKFMGPPVEGTMLFVTSPGPGWDRQGTWTDPRPHGEGSLPRDWARYRGLYLSGDRVVLAYTVGSTDVLELPGCVAHGDNIIVTRTLQFGPFTEPHELLVCEEPATQDNLSLSSSANPSTAIVTGKDWRLVAVARQAPAGSQWRLDKNRLLLKIAAMPKGGVLQIGLTRLNPSASVESVHKANSEPVPVPADFTKGGPAHWREELVTRGTLGRDTKSPYTADDIELPEKNPWGASIRLAGLDFFPDGRAALCTWDGDIWIVSGLDDSLKQVRWKRYAAGLQQPLGLKIVGNVIYTAGRDQVTRLIDLNNDGEADSYENLNNEPGLTLQRHEFVMGLETDAKGNFYYCRSGHYIASKSGANCCIYKLSADGRKIEIIARGFREPNGPCLGPDGTLTVGDNEGNGIPQTPIYRVKTGGFYGFTPPNDDTGKKNGWQPAEPPIVWLGKNVDRSAGAQIWTPKDRFGPLAGQLLHASYGNCALYSLLIDKESDPWQGAVWKFPLFFPSGIMRARFHPGDGHLYLCGLRGWDTNSTRDGVFSRVRFTGAKMPIPIGFSVIKNGISVAFSQPLDKAWAEDDQNWGGTWAAKFTSKREDLSFDSVTLSPDRKTASIHLEELRPCVNFTLQYRLKDTSGTVHAGELNGTIHHVP